MHFRRPSTGLNFRSQNLPRVPSPFQGSFTRGYVAFVPSGLWIGSVVSRSLVSR